MTNDEMLPIIGLFIASGLRVPPPVDKDPVSAAALYARILTRAGVTAIEAADAAEQYLAEPTPKGYPKPWPDPGCLTARIPRLVAVAAIGSDGDCDAAWSIAQRGAGTDPFTSWAELAGDEDLGSAVGYALRQVGGIFRLRQASADDADRMRRAFVAEFRQVRDVHRRTPAIVARIEARVTGLALEDRRGR